MTKQDILKQTGLTEEEFYQRYPTEEAYMMAMGGNVMNVGAPNFFNPEFFMNMGGVPCYNCGGDYMKEGGLSRGDDYGSKKKPYPSVSKGDFAGGDRSYPIPTRADAIDALRLAGLHGRGDVRAKVFAKYPDLKKQFGGTMTQELEGTYPMFNYGGNGTEDMHQMPDGSWMPNSMMAHGGEKQYVNMFKDIIKKALGGPAFPGETQDDIIASKKNIFTGALKNNFDDFMAEEAAKAFYNQSMQMKYGGMPKYQEAGTTGADYSMEGSAENTAFWANQGASTSDQFSEEGSPENEAFWNNKMQASKLGCTDEDKMNEMSMCYDPNFVSNTFGNSRFNNSGLRQDPKDIIDRRTPTDMMVHEDSFENAQGPEGSLNPSRQPQQTPNDVSGKAWSFTTPSGTEKATALMAGLTTATGWINNSRDKKAFEKYKREQSDPNNFMPIIQTGDRGKLQGANWMFQGQTERPNMNNYQAQFQGNNYGTMGSPYYKGGGETPSNFWNASQLNWPTQSNGYGKPDIKVSSTLSAVPREVANLEAEGGETAIVNQGGIPAHFKIQGNKHAQGGVPLNLPENSFIFSDTKSLKIKDPVILAEFGMVVKGAGYTPADIAKKYDINRYRKILADSDSTDLQRKTSELMIANYNEKLAKLSLLQESKKGFPQGIPAISMPYIEMMGINPGDLISTQGEQQTQQTNDNMARYGGFFQAGGYTAPTFNIPLQVGEEESKRQVNQTIPAIQSILEAPQRGMMYAGTGLFGDEARFEMPSETLLRNYPDASPYLTAGLDIFADPLIFAGGFKAASSFKVGKVAKVAAKLTTEGKLSSLSRSEAIDKVLATTGKKSTATKRAVIDAALDAAEDYAHKDLYQIQKKAIRAAGREQMVQDLGSVGKGAKQLAIATAEGAKKITGKIGEKTVQAAKWSAENVGRLDNPYTTPFVLPLAKNVNAQYRSAINKSSKEEAQELYQQKEEENALLKQQILAMQGQKVFNQPPSTQMTKSITAHPDTAKVDIESFKRFGGELDEYQKGGPKVERAKDGTTRTTFADGTVVIKDPQGKILRTTKAMMANTSEADPFEEETRRRAGLKNTGVATTAPVFDKTRVPAVTQPKTIPYKRGEDVLPYGDDPLAQKIMEQYKVKGASDLYGKKIGYQKKTDKGYGEDISLEDWGASNPRFIKHMQDKGITFDPANKEHLSEYEQFHQQDTYGQMYNRLVKTGKSPEEANTLAKKVANQVSFINKEGDVRHTDLKWGNYHRSRKELEFEDPAIAEEQTVAAAEQKPWVSPGIIPAKPREDAPWWLQDEIALGAAAGNFMRVKKYPPWQAKPGTVLPDPSYLDPTRAYAANAEIANIGTQGLAAFNNPQQFSAGFSQIQGAAMKNAADIGAQYDNANVQISNDFERERANILNLKSREDAGLATQLYDKYTIMNQQFDNAKGQRRDQMVNLVNNAITNRAYTQNMNSLFPQYHVGPQSGGLGYHTGVKKEFTGEMPGNEMKKAYDELLNDYGDTEEGRKNAMDLMKIMYGKQG